MEDKPRYLISAIGSEISNRGDKALTKPSGHLHRGSSNKSYLVTPSSTLMLITYRRDLSYVRCRTTPLVFRSSASR
jgi:hypothetical protein